MTVLVTLTEGVGNNLFQYMTGRLLAERWGRPLHVRARGGRTDGIEALRALALPFTEVPWDQGRADGDLDAVYVDEWNIHDALSVPAPGFSAEVVGFFEDFEIFLPHLHTIRWWLPPPPERPGDLAVHVRLGDRLWYPAHYGPDGEPLVPAGAFLDAVATFTYDRLHIVTDMPCWEPLTPEALGRLRWHVDLPETRVHAAVAARRLCTLVEAFAPLRPIVHHGPVAEAFQAMRGFGGLLFEHGTLAWWAAATGLARRVGVLRGFRDHLGAEHRNLAETPLPGWFQWDGAHRSPA